MKDNYTEIAIVLDRSGSMSSISSDTIGGINNFIKEQLKVPGEAKISLYQFDDQYQVDYEGKDLKDAPELNSNNYQPRGSTALFDAMGKTITSLGSRLSEMPEASRPGKVVVVIVTDGLENASREYSQTKVFDMVKHQTDKYEWAFIYLGANQDAISTAAGFGGIAGSSMTYAANAGGVGAVYSSLNVSMANLRTAKGSAMSFTEAHDFFSQEDRKKQEDLA